MNQELPGLEFEIGKPNELGVPGLDGRVYSVPVVVADEKRHVDISISGSAIAVIDVEPEDAVVAYLANRFKSLPEGSNWVEAIADQQHSVSTLDVRNGALGN